MTQPERSLQGAIQTLHTHGEKGKELQDLKEARKKEARKKMITLNDEFSVQQSSARGQANQNTMVKSNVKHNKHLFDR